MSAPTLEPRTDPDAAAPRPSVEPGTRRGSGRLGRSLATGRDRLLVRLTGQARQVDPRDEPALMLSSAFTMIAIVCLWAVAQLLVFSHLSQSRAQDLLYREFRTAVASGTASLGPVSPVDSPVALLTIPSIGLEQVVVEGTASGDTQLGPGHQRTTVLPGQVGTSVIMGRAATYGGPFARIAELRSGDRIETVTGQGKVTFTVLDVRRAGDPFPQPRAATAARLTLVTAEGSGSLSSLTPDEAVYVDAEATQGLPAPSGLPSVLPESEQVMANDTSGLPLLALCMALLLATTLGVVAARQRYSAALVWVVTLPVVIALSWATTDVAARLLPNLM